MAVDREKAELEEMLGDMPSGERRKMARTVLRRILPSVRRTLRQAPKRALRRSLKAPTDVGTLARLLTTSASEESVRALDPLAEAFARGARYQEELLEEAGGTWGGTEVADHLWISPQAVDKRRRRGSLLAVEIGDTYRYPLCQFSETGVVEGLPEVLRAIASDSGWTKLSLLFSGLPERDRDETVLETVKRGEQNVALHAARTWGEQGAR